MTNPQSAIHNPKSLDDVTTWGEQRLLCGTHCPYFGIDERHPGWGFCCGGEVPKYRRPWPLVEANRRANDCAILRDYILEQSS